MTVPPLPTPAGEHRVLFPHSPTDRHPGPARAADRTDVVAVARAAGTSDQHIVAAVPERHRHA